MKNLTPWQVENVRDDMNFKGLMYEEVIEYNKILDGYDGGQVYEYIEGTEPYIKSK